MWPQTAFLSLFFCVLLNSVDSDHCSHSIALDEGDTFHISWDPPADIKGDSEITFKVAVKTDRYFALGISTDGAICGCDFVTGWIDDDGEANFQDRHADPSGVLVEDDQQDYQLIDGSKKDGLLVFEFRRKLDTCDEDDIVIDRSTFKLIYDYSNEIPAPGEPIFLEDPDWKNVVLLQCNIENDLDLDFSSLLQWNITAPDIDISSRSTFYWCKIIKSPPVSEKHHIVYIKPRIQDGHEEYITHMGMYECVGGTPEEYDKLLDDNIYECYQPGTPVQMYRCQRVTASWTLGTKGVPLPKSAGIPIYSGPGRYYMAEIHYDNPKLKTGIIDHSGLTLYYTSQLRNFDAGYYLIGPSPLPRLLIPPRQEEYIVAGHSNPECVSKGFPEDGVRVFAFALQAYSLGQRMTMRLFRGNQELEPLANDKNFDSTFKPHIYYMQERTILPNDHITTECYYDSSERKNVTIGGLGKQDELCIGVLMYYPLADEGSSVSYSAPTFADVSRALDRTVTNEEEVSRVLRDYNWESVDVDEVQRIMRYSQQQSQCYLGEFLKDGKHALTSYPNDIVPYEEESTCDATT